VGGGNKIAPLVSVIIPVNKADLYLEVLLSALEKQTLLPYEILIISSKNKNQTKEIAVRHSKVSLIEIPENSFNHGETRNIAAANAQGDILVFMTQDALPANDKLFEIMTSSLAIHTKAVAVYARQLPKINAAPYEKLFRLFNYPPESAVHDWKDIKTLGLRAFYLSNVCAAYKKNFFLSLRGFEQNLLSNEDMLFAAKAIRSGYKIIYEASAQVFHSHNFSLREQYLRSKFQGYELAKHKSLIENNSPVKIGRSMFLFVTKGLLRERKLISWLYFIAECFVRYIGFFSGKYKGICELKK